MKIFQSAYLLLAMIFVIIAVVTPEVGFNWIWKTVFIIIGFCLILISKKD